MIAEKPIGPELSRHITYLNNLSGVLAEANPDFSKIFELERVYLGILNNLTTGPPVPKNGFPSLPSFSADLAKILEHSKKTKEVVNEKMDKLTKSSETFSSADFSDIDRLWLYENAPVTEPFVTPVYSQDSESKKFHKKKIDLAEEGDWLLLTEINEESSKSLLPPPEKKELWSKIKRLGSSRKAPNDIVKNISEERYVYHDPEFNDLWRFPFAFVIQKKNGELKAFSENAGADILNYAFIKSEGILRDYVRVLYTRKLNEGMESYYLDYDSFSRSLHSHERKYDLEGTEHKRKEKIIRRLIKSVKRSPDFEGFSDTAVLKAVIDLPDHYKKRLYLAAEYECTEYTEMFREGIFWGFLNDSEGEIKGKLQGIIHLNEGKFHYPTKNLEIWTKAKVPKGKTIRSTDEGTRNFLDFIFKNDTAPEEELLRLDERQIKAVSELLSANTPVKPLSPAKVYVDCLGNLYPHILLWDESISESKNALLNLQTAVSDYISEGKSILGYIENDEELKKILIKVSEHASEHTDPAYFLVSRDQLELERPKKALENISNGIAYAQFALQNQRQTLSGILMKYKEEKILEIPSIFCLRRQKDLKPPIYGEFGKAYEDFLELIKKPEGDKIEEVQKSFKEKNSLKLRMNNQYGPNITELMSGVQYFYNFNV